LDANERQAENLLPLIGALMCETQQSFFDLDRVAVCIGPGGFSSIRAGVAAARGIDLAAKLPVVGVTSFRLIARSLNACACHVSPPGNVVIIIPAGADAVYAQVFAGGLAVSPIDMLTPEEAHKQFMTFEGSVAGPDRNAIARCGLTNLQRSGGEGWPDARHLAEMASELDPQVDLAVPCYIRPADARPQTGHAVSRKPANDVTTNHQ